MSIVIGILLTIQLPLIPNVSKELHCSRKRLGTAGKTARTPLQSRQIVPQLGIHPFDPIGLALIWHRYMLSRIIEQFLIRGQQIAVVPLRSRAFIYQALQSRFIALLAHQRTDNAASRSLDQSDYVPSVFLRPTKVCSSSISMICSGFFRGVGAGGN